MSNTVKRGLVLFILISIVTAITIYYTVDVYTLKYLAKFNFISIGVALLMLAIGMYFDGLRLQRLIKMLGYTLSLKAVLRVIFGNYFMAMLTPGASGGAVAQVLILKSYGIPVMEGTPIVLIRTFFSIIFLCICLPFIFIWHPITLPYISEYVLIRGSILLVVIAILGVYLLQTHWVRKVIFKVSTLIKFSPKNILYKLNQLNKGFALLYKAPMQGTIVFIESGLSLLFLYGIAPALMIAFTWDIPLVEVLSYMILLNLILYFAPTPGGAGVAEALFIYLMTPLVPSGVVGIVAVGWRMIAEYVPFLIGMYCVFFLCGGKYKIN